MAHSYLTKDTALLIIDVQERLLKAMPEDDLARLLKATHTLVELAHELGSPIVYTEQYPKGLGATEASLLERLEAVGADRVEKMTFDACSAPGFHQHLIDLPKKIVLCGMETHICVLSTARELMARRHEIIVPFECVISRDRAYRDNGLAMMAKAGATVANYETIVFDALRSAEHPEFKKFSKMIR